MYYNEKDIIQDTSVGGEYVLDWSRNNKNKAKIAATSSLVATAYGALTEILQSTMGYGRTGDLYDLLADIIGIAAAYGIAMWLIRKKKW